MFLFNIDIYVSRLSLPVMLRSWMVTYTVFLLYICRWRQHCNFCGVLVGRHYHCDCCSMEIVEGDVLSVLFSLYVLLSPSRITSPLTTNNGYACVCTVYMNLAIFVYCVGSFRSPLSVFNMRCTSSRKWYIAFKVAFEYNNYYSQSRVIMIQSHVTSD